MSRQGQTRARTKQNVIEFWNNEAREWGESPQVTIRDHYFRLLEIETISAIIRGRANVLDIGCGTGFSTLFYSQHVENIIGADGAKEMVAYAQRFLNDRDYFQTTMERFAANGIPQIRPNVRFELADILELPYPDATFDAVIAERVLINLPEQQLQDEAAREVARVVRPGGVWAVVEVTEQGHERVDELRSSFGLSILEKYWHNLYLDEGHFERIAQEAGFAVRRTGRFETYQFLTKVVHPLVIRPEEPRFLSEFNRAALIVSEQYATYESVARVGLERFLREIFPPVLRERAWEHLPRYQEKVSEVVASNPDFTGCSHQVLFILEKV